MRIEGEIIIRPVPEVRKSSEDITRELEQAKAAKKREMGCALMILPFGLMIIVGLLVSTCTG